MGVVPSTIGSEIRARTALRSWPALLAGGLAAALLIRFALVWARATPNYFPDEYLYASIGRSLAAFGAPAVQGQPARFPALLEPLLTAPGWWAGSLGTGYRIVQGISAASMTLAAVPAYLLARRAGLGRYVGLAVAALALLVPDTVYAGLVLSEPVAYPIVLGACAAAVYALAEPSRKSQILFVILAALAAFTRIQLAVLPLCFVAAVVLIGARERSLRRTLREQLLPLMLVGLGTAAAGALVALRGLGYYGGADHVSVTPHSVLHSLGANLLTLAFDGGWVLVPGALLGLGLCLARPRSRAELAVGAVTLTLSVGLLVETSVFGAAFGSTTLIEERYVFYLAPLAAVCFGLYARRGFPHRVAHALLALGMIALALRFPISGWIQPGSDDHSMFLIAIQELGALFHPGNVIDASVAGATVVAGIAVALSLAGAAAAWKPVTATPVLLALALGVCASSFAGAWTFDTTYSTSQRQALLPADRSWVDDSGAGPTTLLASYGGEGADALQQMFWNRNVIGAAVLPGGGAPDDYAAPRVHISADGALSASGKPLTGALLVDGFSSTVLLDRARLVASGPHFRLWQPAATPKVRLYFAGRGFDGALLPAGGLYLWPTDGRLDGWLELDVRPIPGGILTIGRRHVAGGRIRIPVCTSTRWSASYGVSGYTLIDRRKVSGYSTVPTFRPDPAACKAAGTSNGTLH